MIPLKEWDIYLKNIYDSLDTMDNIVKTPIEEDIFSLVDVEFRIKNDIKGYQAEIFKMGRYTLISHIHKLLNLAVKNEFPKPYCAYH